MMVRGGDIMPVSESRKAANAKWDAANLCRMSLAIPKDLRVQVDAYIAKSGESVNGFIRRAIEQALQEGPGE